MLVYQEVARHSHVLALILGINLWVFKLNMKHDHGLISTSMSNMSRGAQRA